MGMVNESWRCRSHLTPAHLGVYIAAESARHTACLRMQTVGEYRLTHSAKRLYWWVLFVGWRGTKPVEARSLPRYFGKPEADAAVAQLVERVLGKDEVTGPSPVSSFHWARE